MLAILGISHKFAPVSVRELYAFDEQEKITFADRIKFIIQLEGIVILSTCNRTEIYFNTRIEKESEVYRLITDELMKFKKIINYNLQDFYFCTKGMAVEQLFKVSSGLESMVLGEEQILGQVKEAFRSAQNSKLTDCIISRLFIKAIEAGKRVRTETHIARGAASVSSAAVELCYEIFPDLQNRTIMVVGAGQTGDLILQCMLKKNRPSFFIANRTFSRASELAEKYSGSAIELSAIESKISRCDLIITATSSKEHLVTRDMAAKAMDGRENKTQVYIDLSVPSNIAESVNEIENVHYYGVDDLQAVVIKNVEHRKSAIDHSMAIIAEVQDEFMVWLDIQNLTPTIISIKENMKNIQQTELERFIKYRKIKEHELIDQYSEHISEKYAQIFIKKLKQVTENGKNPEYIKVINNLFEPIEND
ncbi:MAG: glutamyl-tRNA reductase [Bacteroidales bacterium]|nr:glutamyl-tRNA reductase [Bacteroidales bacterium]